MPNLTTLHIDAGSCVSPLILSGRTLEAGSLHVLVLTGVQVDLGARFMLGPTTLELHCYPGNIPLLAFLDHIAMLRSLRWLYMDTGFLEPIDPPNLHLFKFHPLNTNPLDLIDMHLVCYVTLSRATELVSAVAKKCVSLEVSTVDIKYESNSDAVEDLEPFFAAISSYARSIDRSVSESQCHYPRPNVLFIRGYCHIGPSHGTHSSQSQFEANLDFRSDAPLPPLLRFAYHRLPIDHLVEISYTDDTQLTPIKWKETFGSHPTLKTVDVEGYVALNFFEALYDVTLFPALKKIRCSASRRLLDKPKSTSTPFLRSLKSRHEREIPIEHLYLFLSHTAPIIPTSLRKRLQSVVGRLKHS
ncbi:hypothetical protein CPB83DRAFT_857208 [Crepidotus variabilis]|uniref:Uncharacterized protein n=1 Tax=Crepidotus variabilis TaxID=179855 RepID=A0A9P6ED94_9AGAR|nr:hypothetical protein CPB83DRAFT_857208 [Crepidotus variabilis]